MTNFALEGNPSVPEEVVGSTQTEQPVTTTDSQSTTPPVTDTPVATEGQTTPVPEVNPVTEYEIDGVGKVTPDDIKEWRSGFMRQSDYTRKTQELALQRQQTQDAIELFEYLRANPALVERLKEADEKGVKADPNKLAATDPNYPILQQVLVNQINMDIDRQLNDIKGAYPNETIDETLLFNTAAELGVKDLMFVYEALRGRGLTKPVQQTKPIQMQSTYQNIDPVAIAREQLRQEMQNNAVATHSIIGVAGAQQPVHQVNVLTEDEKRVAEGMGLSVEEYLKWRT